MSQMILSTGFVRAQQKKNIFSTLHAGNRHALVCMNICRWLMLEISSDAYYDMIGRSYREISDIRAKYLKAVDAIVVSTAKDLKISSWLDIGVGDGERFSELLKNIKADYIVCLEPSAYMAQKARQNLEGKCDIVGETLSHYSQNSGRSFSFMTALWNVIGHCEDPLSFIRDAYGLLVKNGMLVVDANNRYNIKQYGLHRVARNIILDSCVKGPKGVFRLRTRNIGEFTRVYIASPGDLRKACRTLGIKNVTIDYVDYSTGKPASFFTGQMVVRIVKS